MVDGKIGTAILANYISFCDQNLSKFRTDMYCKSAV